MLASGEYICISARRSHSLLSAFIFLFRVYHTRKVHTIISCSRVPGEVKICCGPRDAFSCPVSSQKAFASTRNVLGVWKIVYISFDLSDNNLLPSPRNSSGYKKEAPVSLMLSSFEHSETMDSSLASRFPCCCVAHDFQDISYLSHVSQTFPGSIKILSLDSWLLSFLQSIIQVHSLQNVQHEHVMSSCSGDLGSQKVAHRSFMTFQGNCSFIP